MGRRGLLGRGSVRIFEPWFFVRMVTNCALKCSYFTACLISLDTDRLHHYNHGLYPFEFLAADFRHRWPKYFISSDWPKPETAHEKSVASKALTKRAGQEIRHDLVQKLRHKILCDWTDINLFAIFALVNLLWNVMAIYRQKLITRHSTELLW